jgi:hypothetical protein
MVAKLQKKVEPTASLPHFYSNMGKMPTESFALSAFLFTFAENFSFIGSRL